MTVLYETTFNREHKTVKCSYEGQEYDVKMVRCLKPVSREEYEQLSPEEQAVSAVYPPLNTCTFETEEGLIFEQDVPVKMRDGITIYTDIIRPKTLEKVPVLVAWSAYGKQPFYVQPDLYTKGVPLEAVSKYTKEEGPDPLYWCRYGYAVANVDPRGIGHSEGDVINFGHQEGEDGYDFIEWLAQQPWCNGNVGMAGNSYLTIVQWRIAAQNPPHLKCIAPWEGLGDPYRESNMEGGIPAESFPGAVVARTIGEGFCEDTPAMFDMYPYVEAPHWQDKIAKYEKITIPAYVSAGWSHFHLRGTLLGYQRISSKYKWLRVHRDFEWPDFYRRDHLEELRAFYDRYLKGIRNGWEMTPKVRIEVMDAYHYDYMIDRVEEEFPLARTEYKKLYLDAKTCGASTEPLTEKASVRYDGATGLVNFDYKFEEETELTGYFKLRLWVEADGNDDMDLFVNIQKLSTKGEWLPTTVFDQPHPGNWGKMRVSRRKIDPALSTDYMPVQAHNCDEKLHKGEIVPVDIEIMPTSKIWHKGQYLRIQISGRYIREGWFEPLSWVTNNKGDHIIHTGGEYDSYLQIPVVPPKYVDGDYVYRGSSAEQNPKPVVPEF